jgi:hypothetical protein
MWTTVAVCGLRLYNRIASAYEGCGKFLVQKIRWAVGSEQDRVLLLSTGDLISSAFQGADLSGAYAYDPETRMITSLTESTLGRGKPLPFAAVRVGDTDLSDWVGEVRGPGPCVSSLTLQQVVRLWSLSNHVYVRPGTPLYAVNAMGDEITSSHS